MPVPVLSAPSPSPSPSPSSQSPVRITRNLTGLVCPSIRHEMLYGIDHLVVPVVAIIGDECYWPMDADGYEFAPANVIESSIWLWDNKPVLPIHPDADSANYVDILDQYGFGSVFNPEYINGKLYLEAWMNSERVKQLSGDALDVYNRCADGDFVEVSIGISAQVKAQSGVSASGREYKSVWTAILPDHLAIGLNGKEGACSIERGCGTNRCMVSVPVNPFVTVCTRSMSGNETDTLSDSDIRELLQYKLYDIESNPGDGAWYIWINAVYDNKVIYSVSSNVGPDKYYEREYTISPDGKEVEMGKRTEVVSKTVYEPKVTESGKPVSGNPVNSKPVPVLSASSKADNFKALYANERPGLSRRGLLQKISNLLFSNTDSPAEEAAELVQYRTIETLLGTLETFVTQAKSTTAAMIAAEMSEGADSTDEQAEETLESAQLNSINNLCLSMYGIIAGVLDAVYQCNYGMDGAMGYYENGEGQMVDQMVERKRQLKGAKISAANMKDIQSMHDTAQKLGASCDSSNADKNMAAGDKPCGCKGKGDSEMKDEDVKAMMARGLSGKLTPEDRKYLGLADDSKLLADSKPSDGKPTKPDVAVGADPKALSTPATADVTPVLDYTKIGLPAHVVSYLQRAETASVGERNRNIAYLAANTKMTKAALEAKTPEQLAELVSVAEQASGMSAADYSGLGLGMGDGTEGDDTAENIYAHPKNPWDRKADMAKAANTKVS